MVVSIDQVTGHPWPGGAKLADTAISWELVRSLANARRLAVFQVSAPERQALASGTMWSMSTIAAEVRVLLSYGLAHAHARESCIFFRDAASGWLPIVDLDQALPWRPRRRRCSSGTHLRSRSKTAPSHVFEGVASIG